MPPPGQIPARAQTKNEVRVLLQVSYVLMSGKAEKTVSKQFLCSKTSNSHVFYIVQAIREGMAVDYEIYPHALADFIKSNLLPPLSKLYEGFPWDFLMMIVRETASWQDLTKMDPSLPYFHGRFLKVKTGAKSDGTHVFSAPKNPIEFSLIVDRDQWLRAEDYGENQKSDYRPVESMHSVG